MSYIIQSGDARSAFESLVNKDRPFPGYVYPSDIDREALHELLVAVVCPIPCVGIVNDEGWHNLCVSKADAAMTMLFG